MKALAESRVAVTGRFVSMPRPQVIELITAHGGRYCQRLTPETTLLVVGAAGWPLQANGRLTKSLEQARRMRYRGAAIEILTEGAFLHRLGEANSEDVLRYYTLPELADMLQVNAQRLSGWVAAGLIMPVCVCDGIAWFDFEEVARCRVLCDLAESGVSGRRLYRSLRQVQQWFPEAADVLTCLAVDGRRLIVRDNAGRLAEPHGQLLLDFDTGTQPSAAAVAPEGDDLFERALTLESAGEHRQAAAVYRELLEREGPDPDVWFNLANVLSELGEHADAVTAYRHAVELDPSFAEALSNLGGVLLDMQRAEEALEAYLQAEQSDPTCVEALYGTAIALDECGRHREASHCWRRYLALEQEGECADYARERLRQG